MVKVWLVPNLQLYILASSGDELAALHSRPSEAKVKVVTVHISCSLVNQLTGSYQLCWALLGATEIWLVWEFKEESETRTSSMWPWLARTGVKLGHTRLSCHEGVPSLILNLIISSISILFIGIAVLNLQQFSSGHWPDVSSGGRGWELYRRQRSGGTLANLHRSIELRKWKVSFVLDNEMEQWCLMLDMNMECEYCNL